MPTSAPSTELDESLSAPSTELDESLNKRFLDAAQKGKDKLVKTLIEAGANLDWNDSNGENALMWAALNGHDNVVKTLIDAGAGVDLTNNHDDSALMIAANNGHAGVVNSLINAKANVNLINEIGESALMIAVSQGNVENVNSLIKARADVNFINQKYFYISALIIAVNRGDVENVNSLLDAGADLNLNYHGERALHDASCKGHFKIVNSLIVAGADVDCAPNEGFYMGRTTLEYIALSTTIDEDAKKERLGFLLDIGANVREEFSKNNAISLDIRNFVEEYIKPENALKREENLLKNTNLQDRFKESILAGRPIAFRDNVVDKVLLNALKSITADDLGNASEENVIKLKESGAYALLKIMKDLDDEEIILATKYLGAVKTISNNAEAFRKPELSDDLTSKILMYTLDPKEPPYGLGEKLTLKIINLIKALNEPTNQFGPDNTRPKFIEPLSTLSDPLFNFHPAQTPTISSLVPPGEHTGTGPRPTEPDSTFAPPPNRPNPRNFKFPPNSVVTADLVFAYEVQQEKPGTIPSGPSGVNIAKAVAKTAGLNDSRN